MSALLAAVQYSGLTPLATSMQAKVLQPIVFSLAASSQLAKPVLVLTITDGEPTDNPTDKVVQVRTTSPAMPRARSSNMHVVSTMRMCARVSQRRNAQAVAAAIDDTCTWPAGDQGGPQQTGRSVWPQGSGL